MKIRSLLLGSAAAAGLATGGYAADASSVLSALNACDSLGLSGITIASDDNCIQLSGGVDFRFRYGDYRANYNLARTYDGNTDPFLSDAFGGQNLDWETRTRAWLQVTASSNTDIGRAAAVVGIRQVDEWRVRNAGLGTGAAGTGGAVAGGDHTNGARIDQAYVSIGDATVLTAGLRRVTIGNGGSIANSGDDAPYSFLFLSDKIDGGGVLIDNDDRRFGGTSIQVQSDLGNGFNAAIGLENMGNESGLQTTTNPGTAGVAGYTFVGNDSNSGLFRLNPQYAGTLIGVVQYQGDGLTAHVTGIGYGVMDGVVDAFAAHAGVTGTFDMITVRAAAGYDSNFKFRNYSVATALASAKATFDMFTIAVSGEVANYAGGTDTTIGGNIGFKVSDGVSLNVDGAWFHNGGHAIPAVAALPGIDATAAAGVAAHDTYRVAGGVTAAVTETIALNAAVGGFFGSGVTTPDGNMLFGVLGATWSPSATTKAGASIEVHDDGGYRGELNASKTF